MCCDFFRKKNETLGQKVFELTFNALILGLLVLVAGWWLGNRLAVYDQRKAFVNFQNTQVKETFTLLASAFSDPRDCVLKIDDVVTSTCKSKLEDFRQAIDKRVLFFSIIDPNLDTSHLKAITTAIHNLDRGTQPSGDDIAGKKLIKAYSSALTTAIQNVAKEFK